MRCWNQLLGSVLKKKDSDKFCTIRRKIPVIRTPFTKLQAVVSQFPGKRVQRLLFIVFFKTKLLNGTRFESLKAGAGQFDPVCNIWRFPSSIFRIFWHFLVTKKLMTLAYNKWCQHFFNFQSTPNRLFNNCINLYWY